MAKNPHFRILALTATPGGTPEKVQDLVDALHISHIEIRDEHSLDLKPFIHEKVEDLSFEIIAFGSTIAAHRTTHHQNER